MGVSVGRLREDTVYDYKFVGLSHNTVRGAAGGAVLCAETLKAKGYITRKINNDLNRNCPGREMKSARAVFLRFSVKKRHGENGRFMLS